MTRFIFRLITACLFSLPLLATAQEQDASQPDGQDAPVPPEVQQLYQSALQSIADGRKNDAREQLEKVISREARHAGAWLDLALIQCALGYTSEARRLFDHIEHNFDPPPAILQLINDARAGGCSNWEPYSQTTVTAGRGYSQNVNQGSRVYGLDTGLPIDLPLSDEFRPRGDQYSTLTADYARDLTANGTTGFVQFQGRRYDRLNQYDSSSLFFGVERPWRFGLWTVRANALAGVVTLGSRLYQEQYQLQARVDTPYRLPGGVRFTAIAGFSHAHYRTLTNFDSNTGELRGQFSYRDNDNYATASFGALNDKAQDNRPGGDRHGWLATATWRRALPANIVGELGYSFQQWRGQEDYLPGLIDTARHQDTQAWRGTLTYPLTRKHSLVLEARVIRNKENIPIFQYNDRQLQLSWQWQQP